MGKRKTLKPGSYGPPVDVAPLIADDPELNALDARLLAEGWTRSKTVRPYRRKDGRVTLQFIWRKRSKDLSLCHTVTWRIPWSWVMEAA